ncbi:ATP-dependent (S)-NAD(P)H-hydrate dehydratase isoform X2 [Triticum aestivum]|uniref:ATP-dependent (S)-NAD(P)H-hydrate dehydratase isoform X2 n=1 Tax=Triticum aestivum TaxID=4565 RepID=UPI001D0304C1|nr:ATP-dependent (S)-NAD(P)H-hydrate dehydratase-like isoform X2 [Triticum aestivum]
MWAASPAFRMQLFLLRSLVPTCVDDGHASSSYLRPRAMYATSADAESVIQRITPPLDRARHKGQTGSYLSMPICCSMKIQVDSKVVLLGSGGALFVCRVLNKFLEMYALHEGAHFCQFY